MAYRISEQASPSFCFMPPESLPASRSVNGAEVRERQQPLEGLGAAVADHAAEVGVEVEVFLDGQILVEAESLRHVTRACGAPAKIATRVDAADENLAFNRATSSPAIRRKSVVLPAPSGPTSPVTCAGLDARISDRSMAGGPSLPKRLVTCLDLSQEVRRPWLQSRAVRSSDTVTGMPCRRPPSGLSTSTRSR